MKIKKLLASVLSATMLVGSIAVGNVSSALAATPIDWNMKDYNLSNAGYSELSAGTKTAAIDKNSEQVVFFSEGTTRSFATNVANAFAFYKTERTYSGTKYTRAVAAIGSNGKSFDLKLVKGDKVEVIVDLGDSGFTTGKGKNGEVELLSGDTSVAKVTVTGEDGPNKLVYEEVAADGVYTLTTSASRRVGVYDVKITPSTTVAPKTIAPQTASTSVEKTVGETAEIKFDVANFDAADTFTATVSGSAITVDTKTGLKADANGVVTVTAKAVDAGTATVKLSSGDVTSDEATVKVNAPAALPCEIEVSESTVDLTAGDSAKDTATVSVTPVNTSGAAITYTWSTEATNITLENANTSRVTIKAVSGSKTAATVNVEGKYTLYGTEYTTSSASVTVNVDSTKPFLTASQDTVTLYPGESTNVNVEVSNLGEGVTPRFDWSSASTANVTVEKGQDDATSGAAVVKATADAAPATYTITAKVYDNAAAAGSAALAEKTINVVVKALPEFTLAVAPTSETLVIGEEGKTFTATPTLGKGAVLGDITWAATPASAVTVTRAADGKTAVIEGKTAAESVKVTVTAKATVTGTEIALPDAKAEVTLKVEEKTVPEIVAKAKDDKATAEVTIGDETGATLEVEASVSPASVTGVTLEKSWVSDNESVVVDKTTGKVTAGANAKAGDTAKVTVTVSAKDNTEITPVTVEYTVTVKADPAEEAFALTAVLEDGTAIVPKDGVFALPEGTKKFNVVVKAAKGFDVNSFTGTLTYDADAFKVEEENGVAAGTGDVADKLLTQAILDKALASAANGKIVTIANFAHTDTDLVDVKVAADTVLATFTFSVAAGSEEGAEFAFEAVEIANSNFVDTVKAGDKAAIKVSAPVAAADRYYYLLGDANQTGLIDATDAAFVLTNVQREIADPFEGYANVVDVMEAEPDEGKEFTHIIDATDAAQILVSVQRENVPLTRDISKDVVEAPSANPEAGGATAQFIEVDEATAQAAIAYASANGEDAVANGAVVLNLNTAK